MKMKKILALVLAAVVCLGLLCGCSQKTQEKKLVMATSADYPPFEFHMLDDSGKDVIVGIDVSVAKKIAEDMGLELEIMDISFDNLMTALDKGEADMVIAAMEKDEKREGSVDFSDAYYTDLPPMILVKAANTDKFTSLDSFNGLTVGAQTGTTKEDIVNEQITGAKLLSLSTVTDLVNNLVYDKCDALVLDGAVAMQYAQTNPDLVVSSVALGETVSYHVAVAEGDPKGLLEGINASIAAMIADGSVDTFIDQAQADSDKALVG